MARSVPQSLVTALGGEAALQARVAAFGAALVAHRATVGQPAPIEDPLVESLARDGGQFTVSDDGPPEAAPGKPIVVSRFQMKAALYVRPHGNGTALAAVDAFIAQMGGLAALAWAEAVEIHRYSPLVLAVASNFGWDDAELDALFATANAIKV
jgi:hypothetical protein